MCQIRNGTVRMFDLWFAVVHLGYLKAFICIFMFYSYYAKGKSDGSATVVAPIWQGSDRFPACVCDEQDTAASLCSPLNRQVWYFQCGAQDPQQFTEGDLMGVSY